MLMMKTTNQSPVFSNKIIFSLVLVLSIFFKTTESFTISEHQPFMSKISSFRSFINTNHRAAVATTIRMKSTKTDISEIKFITNKMCPFAQKAWIALDLLASSSSSSVSYELEQISLYGYNGKPDWFMKLNPKGTVPVISVNNGDEVYADSDLILDYLSDSAAFANDGVDIEKKVKWWRTILNEKLIPIGKRAVLRPSSEKGLPKVLKDINDKMEGVASPYLCGEKVSVADCALFPFLWRLDQEYSYFTEKENKNIREWIDFCSKQPSFQKTIQNSWWWWW